MAITPHGYQAHFASIDFATTATHEVIAAITGMKLRVVSMFLRSDDVVTIQLLSGATAIGGTMQMTDGDYIQLNINEYGHFETSAATLLNMELSAAISVDGHVCYVEI